MIPVVHEPEAFREAARLSRERGRRVALVLTMGALHRGHGSLIRLARSYGEEVFVSVFVNPTQFGPSEDFAKYPRTLEADVSLAMAEGATLVFAPEAAQMYPEGEETRVTVPRLSQYLCGRGRPGHFDGVATVVTKFFALAGPVTAIFGRKDYQQLMVIRALVRDLLLPVQVVGAPIIRARDGLAESSRNAYLGASERERALAIPRALGGVHAAFGSGERRAEALRRTLENHLAQPGLAIEYAELADAETLEPIVAGTVPDRCLVAVAVRVGNTRLIDNLVLGEESAPEVS